MSDRRDGAPQQQVDRLQVEDSCRTARSSPTCPSLQSLVNALFHLAVWIAPGDYAPGAVTGAVVSIPATGYFFAWVRRQARATAAELILAVAVGTVVAAVAIGFLSCLTRRRFPSGQRSNRAVAHQPDNLTERRGPAVRGDRTRPDSDCQPFCGQVSGWRGRRWRRMQGGHQLGQAGVAGRLRSSCQQLSPPTEDLIG
jgi:hypothetical protein